MIRSWLLGRVPPRHRTRVRYWYRKLVGRLDRELSIAKSMLRPGSRVLDIGANTGLYAYAFGRTVPVDAFEPLPAAASVLAALADTLPLVTVHQVALSRESGTATLHVPYLNGRPHTELARFTPVDGRCDIVQVPTRRLDEYDFRNIGLMKIDVEGHELFVLEGAAETIARERPVLLVEIEQRHLASDIADTFAAFATLGYQGSFVDPDGRQHPIHEFRYERDQAPYLEDPGDPRYINNFLFVYPATSPRSTNS